MTRFERWHATAEKRFWERVNVGAADECWLWKIKQTGDPYPLLSIRYIQKMPIRAHRAAFFFRNGYLPRGRMVLHRCGNKYCCNPNHLYDGNYKQNYDDSKRHGTACKPPLHQGEQCHLSKLSAELVQTIRRCYPRLPYGKKTQFAALMGVTRDACSLIVRGKNWKHLLEDTLDHAGKV